MPKDLKIFGPYQRGDAYRCVLADGQTRTMLPSAPTPERALRIAEITRQKILDETPLSLAEALTRYRDYLTLSSRPQSIVTAMYRLRSLLPDESQTVKALTPAKCQARYLELAKQQKPDTHRNALAVAKTFGRWLVDQKLVRENPFASVNPIGQRSRGKEQLTNDETKRWAGIALAEASKGGDGALAAYMTLIMGLRAGEVVMRTVRDVDDGGTRLRVRRAKTRAGDRDVKIPDVLQPLIARRCQGKTSEALLFVGESRDGSPQPHPVRWVRDHVRRLCRLAGVPVVCAHSMRGKHADLSVEAGMSPDLVASSVGHTSSQVTMRHYAKPATLHALQSSRAAERLGLASPQPPAHPPQSGNQFPSSFQAVSKPGFQPPNPPGEQP